LKNLGIDWKKINNEPATSTNAENNAEKRDNLWYPYVLTLSGIFLDYRSSTHELPKAILSPKSCKASDKIAKLLVQKPPIISRIVRKTLKRTAYKIRFSLVGII